MNNRKTNIIDRNTQNDRNTQDDRNTYKTIKIHKISNLNIYHIPNIGLNYHC